jgi:hypothetical protein
MAGSLRELSLTLAGDGVAALEALADANLPALNTLSLVLERPLSSDWTSLFGCAKGLPNLTTLLGRVAGESGTVAGTGLVWISWTKANDSFPWPAHLDSYGHLIP